MLIEHNAVYQQRLLQINLHQLAGLTTAEPNTGLTNNGFAGIIRRYSNIVALYIPPATVGVERSPQRIVEGEFLWRSA